MLTAPADVLVLPMTEDLSPAIAAATALRQAGLRAQLYTENKKFKQKMSYAGKLGIPFVLLLGEDEINQGKVSLKNMTDGAQALCSVEEAAVEIAKTLVVGSAAAPIREPEHG